MSKMVVSDYRKLYIEPISPRVGTTLDSDKVLSTYDVSLKDARQRLKNPLARHLRLQEVFGLLIDRLDGKLDGNNGLLMLCDDLLKSYGEWLSESMQTDVRKVLTTVEDPNLVFRDGNYVIRRGGGQRRTYDVSKLGLGELLPLRDVNRKVPKLVVDTYGRPFNRLPSEIRNNAGLVLPRVEWGVRPVGRGDYRYVVNASFNYIWASRGVVPAPKNLHRKRR